LMDEAMSKAVRVRGVTAMTRHMEVEYLRPVPSATQVRIEAKIVRSEGRKHWTEAHIIDEKMKTLAKAKGLFIEVHASRMATGRPEGRPEVA
jgi:acyl-coenzyme A thioesterase PaaI-like protein